METLEANKLYHIYNHANGEELLFKEAENYRYFLQQWDKYISPIAETYAYCLMPNHIHFLIQIKPENEVRSYFDIDGDSTIFGDSRVFQKFVSKQFAKIFSSYTQAFNKKYQRKGSLFRPSFKRKAIRAKTYLTTIVCYIHRNPVHHGFTERLESWKFNSYHAYCSDKPTKINKSLLNEYFGDVSNFKYVHHQSIGDVGSDLEDLLID